MPSLARVAGAFVALALVASAAHAEVPADAPAPDAHAGFRSAQLRLWPKPGELFGLALRKGDTDYALGFDGSGLVPLVADVPEAARAAERWVFNRRLSFAITGVSCLVVGAGVAIGVQQPDPNSGTPLMQGAAILGLLTILTSLPVTQASTQAFAEAIAIHDDAVRARFGLSTPPERASPDAAPLLAEYADRRLQLEFVSPLRMRKGGRRIEFGLFGEGLSDAVSDVPDAREPAARFASSMTTMNIGLGAVLLTILAAVPLSIGAGLMTSLPFTIGLGAFELALLTLVVVSSNAAQHALAETFTRHEAGLRADIDARRRALETQPETETQPEPVPSP